MALSSATVGIRTVDFLETFDIVLHLSTSGAAQADDPEHFAMIYKCHVLQGLGFRRESNHSHLRVIKPVINPHQRDIPVEFARNNQRHSVLPLVLHVLGWVELDFHAINVATLMPLVKQSARYAPMGPNVQVTGAARLHRAASSDRRERGRPFGHAVHEDDSGSEQPAPGNARKRFAHDFTGDRRIVVGLSPKPPAVTEPKVPTQP